MPTTALLAHSDHGNRCAGDHYQRALAAEGLVCRMSGGGQRWDNSPAESFFGRLKCETEVTAGEVFGTRDPARAAIFK